MTAYTDTSPRIAPAAGFGILPGLWARIAVAAICILMMAAATVTAQTRTVTYLENSDHELTIYFINGKEPGNTMMIIGGIQGDEPGGYLAADLYTDLVLESGNLIVVPRANFYSILRNNRGVDGDMNRKFSENEPPPDDYDVVIVDILKSLINQSNVLLNLHEGSGFFSTTWESDSRNPMRYGQSIIVDALAYRRPDSSLVDLEGPAQRVIDTINRNISTSGHRFTLNNHDTLSDTSSHLEQRKSATFYSLTEAGIPAFGIETSKDIASVETKVRYETMVINAFMKEYGIIPQQPSVWLPVPEMDHLVVEIVGTRTPLAVSNGDTLTVPHGSAIHVSSVVANYHRGLSVDITGAGNSNDLGRVVTLTGPTTIRVFKDSYLCGEVPVRVSDTGTAVLPTASVAPGMRLERVQIATGGKNMVVSVGDTLHIVRGDIVTVTGADVSTDTEHGFRLNFVGFVGNSSYNDAEDRGYPVDTARDIMPRFSLDGDNRLFEVRAESLPEKRHLGSVYVSIDEPRLDYLIVERGDGTRLAVSPGGTVQCGEDEYVRLVSVISNVTALPGIEVLVPNNTGSHGPAALPVDIAPNTSADILFRRTTQDLGMISFRNDR